MYNFNSVWAGQGQRPNRWLDRTEALLHVDEAKLSQFFPVSFFFPSNLRQSTPAFAATILSLEASAGSFMDGPDMDGAPEGTPPTLSYSGRRTRPRRTRSEWSSSSYDADGSSRAINVSPTFSTISLRGTEHEAAGPGPDAGAETDESSTESDSSSLMDSDYSQSEYPGRISVDTPMTSDMGSARSQSPAPSIFSLHSSGPC